jgi:membrane protein YqaA with SNARE-associated domain
MPHGMRRGAIFLPERGVDRCAARMTLDTRVAKAGSAMADLAAYAGLFAVAFVAATILPAQSEAALAGLIVAGAQPVALLILAASLGNILGAVVNWALGRGVERFSDRRWFPLRRAQLDRATGWYRRYGRWSLLLSWAPVVGDALTVAAGVLREPFWSFLLLVAIAKTGRYLALAAATLGFF